MQQSILKDSTSNVRNQAFDKYRQAIFAIVSYADSNPWRAFGILTVIVLLVGYLAARR